MSIYIAHGAQDSIISTLNARMAFSGFKLHLCVNISGELLGVEFTPATTDDRKVVPKIAYTDLLNFAIFFSNNGLSNASLFTI